MSFRFVCLSAIGCAVMASATLPAAAGDGFLDRLFGGTSDGAAPANPFASNYPSAPPSPEAVRAARAERPARRSRDAEAGPVPPGRIPQE